MSVALRHQPEGWTVDDVLALPETNDRYELLDGVLIVSPYAAVLHQRISSRLQYQLAGAARDTGWEVMAPANVRLTEETLVVPDLVVVLSTVADSGGLALPPTAVGLLVEIASRSSRRMDRLVKPGVYAEAGIPFYWRVESDPLELVAYRLADGAYEEVTRVSDQPVVIEAPFPVAIDLSR